MSDDSDSSVVPKNVSEAEASNAILGVETGDAHIKYKTTGGDWEQVPRNRYHRIRKIASYRIKNYGTEEIQEKLEEVHDIQISKSSLRHDLKIIERMEIYPMNRNSFERAVSNFMENSQVAKKRFWEISDEEFEKGEDGNPFAAIKAARHAFRTDKEVLQVLADLGFKVEELKNMKADGPSVDDEEVEQAVEDKLDALGIDDLGELVD